MRDKFFYNDDFTHRDFKKVNVWGGGKQMWVLTLGLLLSVTMGTKRKTHFECNRY